MEQEYRWHFRMINQLGSRGFFGEYDIDRSSSANGTTGGNYASFNGWTGQVISDLVSGSGGAQPTMWMNFTPKFIWNKALTAQGLFRIANYQVPWSGTYSNSKMPGSEVAISEGQWTMWWVTANLPWGFLSWGKRPFTFGLGLQYNGEEDLTEESLLLSVPYGPFKIGLGFYPFRRQPAYPFRQVLPNNGFGVPLNSTYGVLDDPYYNSYDINGALSSSPRGFVTYDAGLWSAGVLAEYFSYHSGPESQVTLNAPPYSPFPTNAQVGRVNYPTTDTVMFDGGLYLKYNDGRFFFNTEFDWVYKTTKYHRSASGYFFKVSDKPDLDSGGGRGPGSGSLFAPRYIESWRWMVETGIMAGPTKVSFLYTWLPGPDRRNGICIDRQPYYYGFGNYGVFSPYCVALSYCFGAGLNFANLNGDGYVNDALVLATRLDYALAANLNLFGSFVWMDRAGRHGYGWGLMRPFSQENPPTFPTIYGYPIPYPFQFPQASSVQYQNLSVINALNTTAPSIPDSNVGWEVDTGFDWELLTNWKVRVIAGYWRPGKWFNYACVDRGVLNWNIEQDSKNNWGVNPNRDIDPVFVLRT
ncbi:MAG: hypothetical protein ACP5VS_17000, partial [Desulfomonilaceae bacterium]